jgi:hypothetical protein
MSEKKGERLTEIELKELGELFKQLPDCTREFFRKHSTEIFNIYLEGFRDGATFVIDTIQPHMKRLTENH